MDMDDPKFILSYLQGQLGDGIVDVEQKTLADEIDVNNERLVISRGSFYFISVVDTLSRDAVRDRLGLPDDVTISREPSKTNGIATLLVSADDYRKHVNELPPPRKTSVQNPLADPERTIIQVPRPTTPKK